MPIRYEREDAKRRVRLTVEGAYQMGDVSAISLRRTDDGTWSYGTLCDLRRMTEPPSVADLRQIATEITAGESGAITPRGPFAFLATDPVVYGRVCAYAALRKSRREIEVFRSLEEAEQWLTIKLDE